MGEFRFLEQKLRMLFYSMNFPVRNSSGIIIKDTCAVLCFRFYVANIELNPHQAGFRQYLSFLQLTGSNL